ncbi:MAG TPA: ChpI protein [Vicinamibacteria bacterium]|nr:ChpI protein [Vicinamibacteria bacterium]
MKVAVSVPDPLYQAADRAAKRLRMPRSQFYSRALEAYLKQQDRPDITERLNAVYGKPGTRPDPAILAHNLEMLRRVEWEE